MRWELHIHSRAVNKLFDLFPAADCHGQIAKAYFLSQGIATPTLKHFASAANPKSDGFTFPVPVCVRGSDRKSTGALAIAMCMRREQLVSVEQAARIEQEQRAQTFNFDEGCIWPHFISIKDFALAEFLAWLEPAGATVDDFVTFAFPQTKDEERPGYCPLLGCVHHVKSADDVLSPRELGAILLEHISNCLEQKPVPSIEERAATLQVDIASRRAELDAFFDNEQELVTYFAQARPLARLFHPFFAAAEFSDGAISFDADDLKGREHLSSRMLHDLQQLQKDPDFRPKTDDLRDYLEEHGLLLRKRHHELCLSSKAYFGLEKWTLAEQAALLCQPPKPEIPKEVAHGLLDQAMAAFVCSSWLDNAHIAVKDAKKGAPSALVLRVGRDAALREYYEGFFVPARDKLASDRNEADWRKAHRATDRLVAVASYDEQALLFEHLAITTKVPRRLLVALLPVVPDSGLDY